EPIVVTRSVSGETSMWTPSALADTTVRQTPFTASESPGASSLDSWVASRSRTPEGVGLISATSPTVSTSPVNISFHQHYVTQPGGAAIEQRVPRQPAA